MVSAMSPTSPESLQERFAPHLACFGCGPANSQGLRIRSIVEGERVVADWTPAEHHQAFPGVVSGGIIGALLDCHCNWTAAHTLMKERGLDTPPCTVTAEYSIQLKRPTPLGPLRLEAGPVSQEGDKVVVEGTLTAGGKVCATCRGTFVAVKPGHPAYHRW
ncbi:thioesterase family protein [Cystobacter fuscus DSM 2262]|uniref:Thioesterase family protein n=2 Tax=Cystobacter fuscus TaxID=43 RepID=S9PK14_CYSF2|nr:thioesterase family protein [Cystobacter fuscus DSM 2262]